MNGNGVNVAGCAGCAGQRCPTYKAGAADPGVRRLAAGTTLRHEEFTTFPEDDSGFRPRFDGSTLDLYLVGDPKSGGCGPDSWSLVAMELATYRLDLESSREAGAEHQCLARDWNAAINGGERARNPVSSTTSCSARSGSADATAAERHG